MLPIPCRSRELIPSQSVLYARALLEALEGENEQCVHCTSCGKMALIMAIQIVHYILDPVNSEEHSRDCRESLRGDSPSEEVRDCTMSRR
jgi:hypothetical protein